MRVVQGLPEAGPAGEKAEGVYDRYKRQYDDPSPPGSSGTGSRAGQGAGPASKGPGAGGGAARSGGMGGRAASQPPPPPQKSRNEVIDDDLEELKRRMGMK